MTRTSGGRGPSNKSGEPCCLNLVHTAGIKKYRETQKNDKNLRFGMFRHPAWAVGSKSSGPAAVPEQSEVLIILLCYPVLLCVSSANLTDMVGENTLSNHVVGICDKFASRSPGLHWQQGS